MIAIGLEEIGELIAAATLPIAEEVGRLKKRVAELEGAQSLRDSETIELAPDDEGAAP